MTISPKSDLASLLDGTRNLLDRPGLSLGIGFLGMVLASLAPLLQIHAGLPDDPTAEIVLTFAAMLPLELYFIPRFLIAADARAGNDPLNLPGEWQQRFEERWLRAFWGKMVLYLAVAIGLMLVFLPGVMVLMAFGWVPLRILLRGESLGQAARGSLAMLGRTWARVLLVVSAASAVYLSCILILSFVVSLFAGAEPTAQERLTHPAVWAGNFVASLLSLWLSSCLLALFRKVELPPSADDFAGGI
jgi:hypothetical protein